MIYDAEVRMDMWTAIMRDSVALEDRNKSYEEAEANVNYFEGVRDGLISARDILA